MALTRPKYSSIYDTDFKVSCRVATTSSITTISGGAPNTLDGKNLVKGDRILVKDQLTNTENGVYVVSVLGTGSNGTWVRAKDFDTSAKVTSGILIPVEEGDVNAGRLYMLTTPNPITLGGTGLVWTLISSTGSSVNFANVAVAGQSTISAGSAGDTFNLVRSTNIVLTTSVGAKSITIAFDGSNALAISNTTTSTSNITGALKVAGGAGITGNLYVDAVYTDNYKFANGTPFSVDTSQILNGNSNVKVAANSNVTVSVAGNANVVTVTGTGANINGNLGLTGNISTSGSGGNISGANVILANTFTSNVTNGTSPFVINSNTQVANLNVAVAGNLINGNSNVIVDANSNVHISVAGNANVFTVTGTGANISGTLNTGTGNANVGNLGATGIYVSTANVTGVSDLSAIGNVKITGGSSGQYIQTDGAGNLSFATISSTSISNGTSNVVVASSGNVTVSVAGNANVLTVTGTGANISGTLNTGTGNANLGNVGTGTIIATTANLTTINSGLLQNGTSNVTVNSSGNVNISVGGNVLTVTSTGANIAGTLNTGTGNANVGNLGTGTVIATTANLTTINSGNVIPTANATYYIGNSSNQFTAVYGANLYQNGTRVAKFTTSGTTPSSPAVGDLWYKSGSDVLYAYVNDGTSSFFMDLTSAPTSFGNITVSNLTVSTSSAFTGNLTMTGNILPAANATYTLGSTSARWSNIWGLSSSAQYADLAERYMADQDYSPGTVVIFGGNAEITVTTTDHDPRAAGVISTDPAYLMNDHADQDKLMLPVALTGRVPAKVRGPVRKGDMIVTSTEAGIGIKMKKSMYEPGCIIGKSLDSIDDDSVQTIEIVVGRY